MKKLAYCITVITILFSSSYLLSQPCNFPPSQLNCEDVEANFAVLCNVSDLDGYCTTLPDFPNGTGPSPLCQSNGGGSAQNTIWFGFIAGTATMSITVIPQNCTTVGGQSGIQTGIYQAPCPPNGTEIVCQGNCSTDPINLTSSGFTPGNLYFFWIDGCSGSVCDITIDVIQGGPLMMGTIGPISGPKNVCTGGTFTYSVDPVNGADYYYWTLDGTEVDDPQVVNEVVQVTFDNPGVFQLCLDVANFCLDVGAPPIQKCIDVTVTDVVPVNPPTKFACAEGTYTYNGTPYFVGEYEVPLTTNGGCDSIVTLTVEPYEINPVDPPIAYICSDDKYSYAGKLYNVGQFDVTLKSWKNCDSLVTLTVEPIEIPETDLGIIYNCKGDCITVEDNSGNGGIFCNDVEGEEVILDSWQGCDSLVTFTLRILDIDVKLDKPYVLGCLVDQTPLSGSASIVNNADEIIYKWEVFNGGKLISEDDEIEAYTETAGKYCLNITAISETGVVCKDSACVIVYFDPNAPTANVTGDTLSCIKPKVVLKGSSNDPNGKYDWKGPGGSVFTGKDITVSVPGNYTLTVTAQNLCSASSTYKVISLKAGPNIAANGDTISCNFPTKVLTGSSTTPGVSFKWFDKDSTIISNSTIANVSQAGNYTFLVHNNSTGCDTIKQVTVIGDFVPPQNVTALGDTFTCFKPKVKVLGNSSSTPVSYSWKGPNGFNSNIQNPDAPNAGNYTLVVKGLNGCTDTAFATITSDTISPSLLTVNDTIDCFTYLANLSASSNAYNPVYSWAPGPGSGATFIVANSGNYTVTVTDSKNGCIKTGSAKAVDDPNKPKALIVQAPNLITCDSLQVTLYGGSTINIPGINFIWSFNDQQFANSIYTLAPEIGTYQLLVINSTNGCKDSITVVVDQNITPPDISAIGDTTDCISGQAILKGFSNTLNAQFNWYDNLNVLIATTKDVTVSGAGDYTLETKDPINGCISKQVVKAVKDEDTPDISLFKSNDLDCNITSVDLTASSLVNGVIYNWSPGVFPNDPNISVSYPDTFTVTVTNPINKCKNSTSVIVTQDIKKPQISATTDTIKCNNNMTATIDGTSDVNSNISVTWVNKLGNIYSDTLDFTTSIAQLLTLTVINNINGCVSTLDLNIPKNTNPPNYGVGGAFLDCIKTIATAYGESNTPNVIFNWTGPGGYTASTGNATGIDKPGIYFFTITDTINGCATSTAVEVIQDTIKPDVSAKGGTLKCSNNSQLILNSISSVSGAKYSWTGPNGFTSNDQNPVVFDPGTYTLVVTNNSNGCTKETSVVVLADENKPDLTVNNATLDCKNPKQTLKAISNTPGVTYLWMPGNEVTATIDVTKPGNYTVVCTAPNGCSESKTSLVDLNAIFPIAVAATKGEINCTTKSVDISSTGSSTGPEYVYEWTGPNGFSSASQNLVATEAGEYFMTISNTSNGCKKDTFVIVAENTNKPTGLNSAEQSPKCFGSADGSISVTDITGGTPPYLYSLNGKAFSSQNQFSFLTDGTYKVSIQDAAGCEFETLLTLVQPNKLTVDAGRDSIIKWGTPIQLYANASNSQFLESISWSPQLDTIGCFGLGCLQQNVTLFDAQLFTVTVKDSNNCVASDKVLILVKKERPVFFPNVFSPNGDGINDLFYINSGDGIEEVAYFQIYDRWGNKIFEKEKFQPNDPKYGWNGEFRNKKVNNAVFVYWAMIKFKDGEEILYKGDVTIQR